MLVLATKNKHKVGEIAVLLAGIEWRQVNGDWHVEENPTSLMENAVLKAREARRFSGSHEITLGEDTGLFVPALGGAPGPLSARYAGENVTFDQNVNKLLDEMKAFENERRQAYFLTVAALAFHDGRLIISCGRLDGLIIREPRGSRGFGYDPVFMSGGSAKTLAEIGLDEKNAISHRAKAIAALMPYVVSC
ncbi:MAG: RdgB/HAM1 family non-canonical purine NTP pyrophosphatase [Elusimicrobia bacterium]|nr:RdgB/HAM1 family non-canonical purine NTP pyrophosphatase [Elusimicrobiota bacterium]